MKIIDRIKKRTIRKRVAYTRQEAMSAHRAYLRHLREFERQCAAHGVPVAKVDPCTIPHPGLLPGEEWVRAGQKGPAKGATISHVTDDTNYGMSAASVADRATI